MSKIRTGRYNGLGYQYILADPSDLDLAFKIGSTVKDLGSGYGAAVNFPYADTETGTPIGMVVTNGEVVIKDEEKTKNRDMFYVTESGEARIGPYPNVPIKFGAKGSPRLLRGGKSALKESIARDRTPSDITDRAAQRTALGIRPDGTVVILVTNTLLYLEDLEKIMLSLGCEDALNGDGGGSSYLWPEDTGWGRKVGAAIVVKKEVKKSMKFAIDAGHGPNTAGKRPPDDSFREFHFNSVVAEYVAEGLKDYEGVEILFTHDTNKKIDVPLEERTDKANDWKADVLVSIHANAHGDGSQWTSANGIETLVYTNASRASVALAVSTQRNLILATGLEDRGVKHENKHMVRETDMPAILVECGFMTNRKEADLLKSDEYRRTIAKAIVKSLVEVYGLKKKEGVVKVPDEKLPQVQRRIGVSVNGDIETSAYLIDNVTHVPIRMIAEYFGATVDWNDGNPVRITKEVK